MRNEELVTMAKEPASNAVYNASTEVVMAVKDSAKRLAITEKLREASELIDSLTEDDLN